MLGAFKILAAELHLVDARNISPHGLPLRSLSNFVLIKVWSMKTNGIEQIGLRQPTICAPLGKFHKIPYANRVCRRKVRSLTVAN